MIEFNATTMIRNGSLGLPRYGLGAAHINRGHEAEAIFTVQTAFEQGIRLFDTAPLYGSGKSEVLLGQALSGIDRKSFVLASKVGRLVQSDGSCVYDFSREGILRSFEESLNRLKLNSIDILHIHDPDNHYQQALDGAFPVLAELRDQGVIKAIGAGMNQWQMLADFATHADFDCFLLAGRYTLLEQPSLKFLDLCHKKHIAVILGGVFNSGILASDLETNLTYDYQKASQKQLGKARQIQAICQSHDVSLKMAALQFPYLNPAVTSTVVGAESAAQVETNLADFRTHIPQALWDDLFTKGLIDKT